MQNGDNGSPLISPEDRGHMLLALWAGLLSKYMHRGT